MATILKKLTVDAENLGIFQPILKAEIWNRRSYLVDTFVTIPDFYQKFIDIQNNELLINLLRNTYGSFYEIVLFGAENIELLRCFFIMPDNNSNLSDIRLLTAYPEASIMATSFLMLSDTPDSYFQQGGKVVAVRKDEKGLEFIDCHCNEEANECDGATSIAVTNFQANHVYTICLNDVAIVHAEPLWFNFEGELFPSHVTEALLNKIGIRAIMDNLGHWIKIEFKNLTEVMQRMSIEAFDENIENIPVPIFTHIEQDNESLRYFPENLASSTYSKVTFCLEKGGIFPPYAVFKTTAEWGTILPATITINGAVYSGNLYGGLADTLAHNYSIYTGLERQEDNCYRVVFAGDVFADNFEIKIELNMEAEISIDDSQTYPSNSTILLNNLASATFKLGKLVCAMGVWQHTGVVFTQQEVVFENTYFYSISDRILGNSITRPHIAGVLNGDPSAFCENTYDPQGCIQLKLKNDLAQQWNTELVDISAQIADFNQNPVLEPLNSQTAKMVIQPTEDIPITEMYALAYVIPVCQRPM